MTWSRNHSHGIFRSWELDPADLADVSASVTRWDGDREYEARGCEHDGSHNRTTDLGTYSDRPAAMAACEAWIAAYRAGKIERLEPRAPAYAWATDEYCDAYDRGEIEGPAAE